MLAGVVAADDRRSDIARSRYAETVGGTITDGPA